MTKIIEMVMAAHMIAKYKMALSVLITLLLPQEDPTVVIRLL